MDAWCEKCIVFNCIYLKKPALVIYQETKSSEVHWSYGLIIYWLENLYIWVVSLSQNTLVFLLWTMFETSENYFFKAWTILSPRSIAINWIRAAKINYVIHWIVIYTAFYQS